MITLALLGSMLVIFELAAFWGKDSRESLESLEWERRRFRGVFL
jgi:hypothetical protein